MDQKTDQKTDRQTRIAQYLWGLMHFWRVVFFTKIDARRSGRDVVENVGKIKVRMAD